MSNLSVIVKHTSLNIQNGQKITAIRKAVRIKRIDLARTTQLDLSVLTAIERGICDTSWRNIALICDMYPQFTWWLLLDDLPFVTQLIPNKLPLAQQARNALSLSQRIFYLRKYHLNISRLTFAKSVNISYNVLIRIEEGQIPSISKMQLICKHFPQYTYWLINGHTSGVQQTSLSL